MIQINILLNFNNKWLFKDFINIFQIFLRATNKGTYKPDSIYVGEISVELIDEYIKWRREVKQNSNATINHALTPIPVSYTHLTLPTNREV